MPRWPLLYVDRHANVLPDANANTKKEREREPSKGSGDILFSSSISLYGETHREPLEPERPGLHEGVGVVVDDGCPDHQPADVGGGRAPGEGHVAQADGATWRIRVISSSYVGNSLVG